MGDGLMNWLRALIQGIGIGRPNTLKADDFGELEGQARIARRDAMLWYRNRYGKMPVIRPVRIIVEDKPRNGMAGWTISVSGGYQVHLARQYIETSIEHEFRHTMGCASEGAVR